MLPDDSVKEVSGRMREAVKITFVE